MHNLCKPTHAEKDFSIFSEVNIGIPKVVQIHKLRQWLFSYPWLSCQDCRKRSRAETNVCQSDELNFLGQNPSMLTDSRKRFFTESFWPLTSFPKHLALLDVLILVFQYQVF